MSSDFRVGDIVNDPSLDTHAIAGADGLERPVIWAHSCEFRDPEKWLGPHELLMTIGLGVPSGASAQRAFIAALDDAGLAGVAIGVDGIAPKLTKAMLAEADARAFPILRTGSNTPFAVVGRTVAAANTDRQTMTLLLLAKLYQISGGHTEQTRRSGALLSELFRTPLTVVDDATGCVIIGNSSVAPSGLRAYALRTQRPTHLHVDPGVPMDGFALVHLTQVLAVDANAILQDAVATIERGAASLDRALAKTPDAAALNAHLGVTDDADFRIVVLPHVEQERVALSLTLQGVPSAVTRVNEHTVVAVSEFHLDDVRDHLIHVDLTAGVSSAQHDFDSLAGALTEAAAELAVAISTGERWRQYRGERLSLLSRSREESQEIITTVLGVLAGGDDRSLILRTTLFVLLEEDLNWGRAAQRLDVHRQTIVYRMNTIEQLTGRSVRRVQDLGEFWIAFLAWNQSRAVADRHLSEHVERA